MYLAGSLFGGRIDEPRCVEATRRLAVERGFGELRSQERQRQGHPDRPLAFTLAVAKGRDGCGGVGKQFVQPAMSVGYGADKRWRARARIFPIESAARPDRDALRPRDCTSAA
jgi:hypothetical protein